MSHPSKIISTSPQETRKLGAKLAKKILKEGPGSAARVFGLSGDLGSGKTTFVQGFGKGLGIEGKITSPTYLLIRRFALNDSQFKNLYHIDCYRLKCGEELLLLGFSDICSPPQNIVFIEWAGKVKSVLSERAEIIRFEHLSSKKRQITFPAGTNIN